MSTCSVLVAEDDPILALDLIEHLNEVGLKIIGPVIHPKEALNLFMLQENLCGYPRLQTWNRKQLGHSRCLARGKHTFPFRYVRLGLSACLAPLRCPCVL